MFSVGDKEIRTDQNNEFNLFGKFRFLVSIFIKNITGFCWMDSQSKFTKKFPWENATTPTISGFSRIMFETLR